MTGLELASTLEIVPGRSIGPVALGMPLAAFENSAAATLERDDGTGTRTAKLGPVRVVLDGRGVSSVEVEVGVIPLTVSGKAVPTGGKLEELAALFPDCGKLQRGEGGDVISCAGGTTLLKRGAGAEQASIQVLHR